MRNPLAWLVGNMRWPISLLYSDMTREVANVDVLGLETWELQSEHDTCARDARGTVAWAARYTLICRLAALEGEAQRRGHTLS